MESVKNTSWQVLAEYQFMFPLKWGFTDMADVCFYPKKGSLPENETIVNYVKLKLQLPQVDNMPVVFFLINIL